MWRMRVGGLSSRYSVPTPVCVQEGGGGLSAPLQGEVRDKTRGKSPSPRLLSPFPPSPPLLSPIPFSPLPSPLLPSPPVPLAPLSSSPLASPQLPLAPSPSPPVPSLPPLLGSLSSRTTFQASDHCLPLTGNHVNIFTTAFPQVPPGPDPHLTPRGNSCWSLKFPAHQQQRPPIHSCCHARSFTSAQTYIKVFLCESKCGREAPRFKAQNHRWTQAHK